MCGLAGILSFDASAFPVEKMSLLAMRDSMAHRGPDGAGIWVDGGVHVGLAHRRLAIIDLSDDALQPMATVDGRFRIVFNGEIYNHAELRQELVQLGHREWQTDHSDTEVVLMAFRQWGITCLNRFRGMFALALWDTEAERLWLARDRVGIKPLYYALDERGIVFASEIKAILAGPDRPRAVDEEALFHYLSFLTTPAPMTLFEGINKLEAGTWACIQSGGEFKVERWWDALDKVAPLHGRNEREIADAVLEELQTAVTYRKASDVPVGVFLSGGIDSSTNVALFSKEQSDPVKTFSIGYGNDQSSVADELPYAREAAESARAEYHEYLISQDDFIDFLPKMVRHQDEPIADPVCVPVYYVSKLARDNDVKVCQVGEGADELFWGYPGWKVHMELDRYNAWPVPKVCKKLGVAALRLLGRERARSTEFLRRASVGLPVFWGGAEAFTEGGKHKLLSPRLRNAFAGRSSWEALAPIRQRFEDKAWDTSTLSWMSYLDLNLRLPELLLMRVDKMSMAASIEARVPFLDHHFVRLALSIPPALKTKGGELKYLLKTAVRGLIPDRIIDRKKQGFAAPLEDWVLDRLGHSARQSLRTFCDETDFFARDEDLRVLDKGPTNQIWCLLNLAMWWNIYIKHAAPASDG